MSEPMELQEAPLLSYTLASADMRYIETGQRDIYLRDDPVAGPVYRGEIPGCGPGCFVDLSEILLEYAMTCEGCKEEVTAPEEAVRFGAQLGGIIVTNTLQDREDLSTTEILSAVYNIVLNSMRATYSVEVKDDRLVYTLDCCPLRECAKNTGLGRSVQMAHLSFAMLCINILEEIAPGWRLLEPSASDTHLPIHKVVMAGL